MKLLTITVPAYNVEKTLSDTLDSFLIDEIIEYLDIIIVDDGSIDATAKIAAEYVERYPLSFRLISKANGGHGSTVNTGIENATGKYFSIVDGDDRLEAEGFKKLINLLKTTDSDIIASNYKKIPLDGSQPIEYRYNDIEYGRQYSFDELPLDNGLYMGLSSTATKTEILKSNNIRLQEKTFYVDVEYVILPIPYANSVEFLDAFIYLYYIGSAGQSINSDNLVKRYDEHYRVVKRMVDYAANCNATAAQKNYINAVLRKLCFTHYMISAFYDKDTHRAKQRLREFDSWLLCTNKELYKDLSASKYIALLRLVNFSVLPKGEVLKNLIKSLNKRVKSVFKKKRRFTY